ncbi:MAG: Gfo/Idh/MocA family oxidoreductase [Cyclobacteriaceae bacterium]|nr:Gfo/Idh/MocA family oxidoreductase [Cyclobacteriaceae bacterium]
MKKFFFLLSLVYSLSYSQPKPFPIAIAGLTHTHVHWLLGRADDGDIEIVGIAEPNRELAERYLKQYKLPLSLLYPSLEEMLKHTRPAAVAAFGSIFEHLEVVKQCAEKNIHVMVEKPLAVSLDHARQIEALAKKHGIHVLTNYETTWYASNYAAREQLKNLGPIRKIVAHHGHQGPKEIGVNREFLDWLTDPVANGGGALMDFGCYGANLMTWLMNGERPLSVTAVTQHFKPDVYPKVEDEATLILTYPKAQGIIQASWNWPYNRKDLEVYGLTGYVIADRNGIKLKASKDQPEEMKTVPSLASPVHDPFAYLAAVVRGEIIMTPTDLSSLPNNMIVVEILEAGKESARSGKTIYLGKTTK